MDLEQELNSKIIGQTEVIGQVSRLVARAMEGFHYPGTPLASMIFLGPTGTGKTASVLIIAESMFGPNSLARFDMSEYMLPGSEEKLLGFRGQPGIFEGKYRDTKGRGVLLWDEIEKADPKIQDLLHQMLSAACITTAKGRILDLSNYIFIATSNIGDRILMDAKTDRRQDIVFRARGQALREIRPAIFARFQLMGVFTKLTWEATEQITRIHIEGCQELMRKMGHSVTVSEKAVQYIRKEGYVSELGARPIKDKALEIIGDAILREKRENGNKVVEGILDFDFTIGKYAIKRERTSELSLETSRNGFSQSAPGR